MTAILSGGVLIIHPDNHGIDHFYDIDLNYEAWL